MAKRIIEDLHGAVARDVRVPLAIKVLQCPCFTDQTGTEQYRRIYNDL